MNFQTLINEYLLHWKRYENSVKAECKKGIAAEKLSYPTINPKEVIFDPIVEWLKEWFPKVEFEIAGPFGIRSHYLLCMEDDKSFLSLEWENNGIYYRDFSVDNKEYPKNSIGYINGLNHPRIKITETQLIVLVTRELGAKK